MTNAAAGLLAGRSSLRLKTTVRMGPEGGESPRRAQGSGECPGPAPDLRGSDLEAQDRAASPGRLRVPTTMRTAGRRRAGASRTR